MANGILYTTEQAVVKYLKSGSFTNYPVYSGMSTEDKTIPNVVVYCENATEAYQGLGVWKINTHVLVTDYASDNDDPATSDAQSDAIFNALCQSDTETKINNYYTGSNSIYAINIQSQKRDMVNTDSINTWETEIMLEIVAVNNG